MRGVEAARKFIADKPLYTLNKQIQEIMGDLRAHYRWSFTEPDMDSAADRLVSDCLEYASSFYEQFRSLDDIINALEGMTLARRSIPKESLALAYCVQGRLAEAEEALPRLPARRLRRQLQRQPRQARLYKRGVTGSDPVAPTDFESVSRL
jgi:hypothetical protein